MAKKVSFDYPLSETKDYEGKLIVEATVNGQDVDIDSVIFEDKHGNKSEFMWMLVEWCGNLYTCIEEAAINNSVNTEDFSECRTRQYA
jgi:hypothetical protein